MSDYDQWRQNRSFRAAPDDTGGAALFWVLVVVAALGALVFAGSLGGSSVPGDDAALPQGLVVPDATTEPATGATATDSTGAVSTGTTATE
ncbi:MAG: hypothetical protein AAFW87_00175 [Pseudomonadota bacterium]